MSEESELIEQAVRMKLRWPYRGQSSVEDMYDLPVEALDEVYKNLNAELKTTKEESLLEARSDKDLKLQLRVDIIKYIVKTKLEEKEARKNEAAAAAQKKKIMGIIAKKQDEGLEGKSIEDLQKMIENL